MTQVAAGILEENGKLLICRRRADQPHAGKWEFPGGKLEPGESPEEALGRELHEELGIRIAGAAEMSRYSFSYEERRPILLIFLRVLGWKGEVENRIFDTIRWEFPAQFHKYDFLEGDGPFIRNFLAQT